RLAEGGRYPGEVDHPRGSYWLPIDLSRRQPGKSGIPPIVEHAHRSRRHAVLEEIDADARALRHAHVPAIDTVTGELTPDALAPGAGGRRGTPGNGGAAAGPGRPHVGLGPAELQVELPRRLEARGRRNREPQQHLAERDEVVHLTGLQADLDGRSQDHGQA